MGMGICYSLSRLDKLLPYQFGKWVLPRRMVCVTCSQHLRLEIAKCNLYNNTKLIKKKLNLESREKYVIKLRVILAFQQALDVSPNLLLLAHCAGHKLDLFTFSACPQKRQKQQNRDRKEKCRKKTALVSIEEAEKWGSKCFSWKVTSTERDFNGRVFVKVPNSAEIAGLLRGVVRLRCSTLL